MKTAEYVVWLAITSEEKDRARQAAGKLPDGRAAIVWDGEAKLWYARPGCDLDAVREWLPDRSVRVTGGDAQSELLDVLTQAGLIIDGLPIMDGERHRVYTIQDKKGGKKSGMYRGFDDRRPGAWYINYHTADADNKGVNWKGTGGNADPVARMHVRAGARQASDDSKRKQAASYAAHTANAKQLFDLFDAAPASNEYANRKGVTLTPGLKQTNNGSLVIPLSDVNGNFQTLQYIPENGAKYVYEGAPKQGSMHVVGGDLKNGEPILYAEGYATARSVNMATNIPVVMTVDGGNMATVAGILKSKYPDSQHVFLADFDHTLDQNKGLIVAKQAADRVGGIVIHPNFTEAELAKGKSISDFNDLHQSRGLDEVFRQLAPTLGLAMEKTTMPENQPQVAPTTPEQAAEAQNKTYTPDHLAGYQMEPIDPSAAGDVARVQSYLEGLDRVRAEVFGTEVFDHEVYPNPSTFEKAWDELSSAATAASKSLPAVDVSPAVAVTSPVATEAATPSADVKSKPRKPAAAKAPASPSKPKAAAAPKEPVEASAAQELPDSQKAMSAPAATTKSSAKPAVAKPAAKKAATEKATPQKSKPKKAADKPVASQDESEVAVDKPKKPAAKKPAAKSSAKPAEAKAVEAVPVEPPEATNAGKGAADTHESQNQEQPEQAVEVQRAAPEIATGEQSASSTAAEPEGGKSADSTADEPVVSQAAAPGATDPAEKPAAAEPVVDATGPMNGQDGAPVPPGEAATAKAAEEAVQPASQQVPTPEAAPASSPSAEMPVRRGGFAGAWEALKARLAGKTPEKAAAERVDPTVDSRGTPKAAEATANAENTAQAKATGPSKEQPAAQEAPAAEKPAQSAGNQATPNDAEAAAEAESTARAKADGAAHAAPGGDTKAGQQQGPKAEQDEEPAPEVDGIWVGERVPRGSEAPSSFGDIDKDALLARLSTELQNDKTVLYKLDGDPAFLDRGTRLEMASGASSNDEKVLAALLIANRFYSGRIELTGSDEFKAKAIGLIARYDLQVTMINAVQRMQLDEARRAMQMGKGPSDGITGDELGQKSGPAKPASPGQASDPFSAEPVKPAQDGAPAQPGSSESTATASAPQGSAQPQAAKTSAPEDSKPKVDPSVHQVHTAAEQGVTGKILDFGKSPFRFDEKNSESYYITLRTRSGTETYWGKELASVIRDKGAKGGDIVDLKWLGKTPAVIQVPIPDEAGKVTGYVAKDVHVNKWKLEVIQHAAVRATPDEGVKVTAFDASRFAQVQELMAKQLQVTAPPIPDRPRDGLFWITAEGAASTRSGDALTAQRPAAVKEAGQPVLTGWGPNGELDLALVRSDGDYLQGVVRHGGQLKNVLVSLPGTEGAPRMVFNEITENGLVPIGTGNAINKVKGEPVSREYIGFRLDGDSGTRAAKLDDPASLPPTLHSRMGFDERWRDDNSLPKSAPAAAPSAPHSGPQPG